MLCDIDANGDGFGDISNWYDQCNCAPQNFYIDQGGVIYNYVAGRPVRLRRGGRTSAPKSTLRPATDDPMKSYCSGPRARQRARGFFLLGLLACSLLPVLGAGAASPCRPPETPRDDASVQAPTPADDEETVQVDQTAGSVVGGLQGQAGVRVQTMCTHCNSANVQVGGLSQDLVPMFFGPYPLIGGLAVSYVLNMLPPDSVAEAQASRAARARRSSRRRRRGASSPSSRPRRRSCRG